MEYQFRDENLYKLALTHSSYGNEKHCKNTENNERLEFLGDSVLSIIVSNYLYRTYSDLTEGELTKLRAGVVCESALARLARKIQLGERLYLGHGEECSGGRERDSILADAFEAHLGAMFLDGGMETAEKWLLELIVPLIESARHGRTVSRDYKTALQEASQKGTSGKITYETISEEGPDHDKVFCVCVFMDNRPMARGSGHSKKEAEQMAAKEALEILRGQKSR